jgi:hypothetical protein
MSNFGFSKKVLDFFKVLGKYNKFPKVLKELLISSIYTLDT